MIPIEDRVIRKCFVRLVWFLCVLHCISYLDRINIGFAALSMNSELGLDATSFGIAGSIFYAGYVLCEVPSNLIMARVGARIWLARIMITWGIASAATILATGLDSLLGFRLLVGIAEAGFVPGVLLYITYWFPSTYRARAMSLFLIAQPITLAVGSTISGLILELDGTFGLSGWRWLFLLEGMPAIIFGVAAYYYLPNGPSSATWLRADESATLQSVLEAEHRLEGSHESRSGILSQLLSRNVVLLSLAYFGLTVGLTANSTWAPQILQTWRPSSSFHSIGLIAAIPALVAIVAMPLWAADSDRKKERVWHLCIPFLLSALGWMLVALSPNFAIALIGLILCLSGAYMTMSIFWTLPSSTAVLSSDAQPAGLALINATGVTGSLVSPVAIGILKDATGSFSLGMLVVAGMLVVSAISAFPVAWRCRLHA